MNNKLSQFAREELKQGLQKCTDPEKHVFKRLYSHDNLELPINEVVDNMPDEELDWAMQ